MTQPIRLADTLDPDLHKAAFTHDRRVRIPGFLETSDAERLHGALRSGTPWVKSLLVEGRNVGATARDLRAMSPSDVQRLTAMRMTEARSGFQFAFDSWPVSDEVEADRRVGHPAEAFYDLLNSQPFFDFIRRMTGEDTTRYCDAQCTRYGPGDFLNVHSDHAEGKHRLFAYVLSLTPEWRTDWGGLLLFPNPDGGVDEGFAPAFNTLSLFSVPQTHLVSVVAPFAGAPRLSITGWLRAQRPR